MKRIKLFFALICALAFVSQIPVPAFAGGSAQEAQQLVDNALKYCKDHGKEKAIEAFNDSKGQFVNGELYIFMFDTEGLCLAHGYNPKLVGKNLNDLKDANGVLFIQQFAKMVKNGGGWVDYQWTNPETKKVQDKSSYVKGVEGTNLNR
jgi:cytochrome c